MSNALLAAGFGINAEGATALVIKALAVGGGFLVGYFLGSAIAWALDRWVFAKQAPEQLKKAVSLLSGIGVAILVALILFGEGGTGLFGGGGKDSDKKGNPDPNEGKQQPVPPKKDDIPPKKDDVPMPPLTPKPGDLIVKILAGDKVKDGKFYLVEDDMTPKTLEQLKAIYDKRKEKKNSVQVIWSFEGAELPRKNIEMQRFYAWIASLKQKTQP